MPSLLDNIDRFTYTAQQIQSSSKEILTNSKSGRFSCAVLHLPLGDRARDADASELGLFTLVAPPAATTQPVTSDDENIPPPALGEITRAEVPAATPLRKPAGGGRMVGGSKGKIKDKEPEVYAEAALKYLNRYEPIKAIPRARQEVSTIIDRLNTLRNEIESMTTVIEQSASDASQGTSVKEEEKRIQQLQTRIKQLRARKEVMAQKHAPAASTHSPMTASDVNEEAFWGTSSSKPRPSLVLQDNDDSMLLDGEIDIGDVSVETFAGMPTPLPTQPKQAPVPTQRITPLVEETTRLPPPQPSSWLSEARLPQTTPQVVKTLELPPGAADISFTSQAEDSILDEGESTFEDDADDTVILPRPPVVQELPPRPRTPPRVDVPMPSTTPGVDPPSTPTRTPSQTDATTPATGRKQKLRITNDTERIAAKIWSTVGELIMPGHPFNTAAAATTNKPPRAKETIALLETMASKSPPHSSPSNNSLSSFSLAPADPPSATQPNAQQILTALLLHTLLVVSPTNSMPLSEAKKVLSAKGLGPPPPAPGTSSIVLSIIGGQAIETRALYGCIAKRLLKIDRTGREQILKFDV